MVVLGKCLVASNGAFGPNFPYPRWLAPSRGMPSSSNIRRRLGLILPLMPFTALIGHQLWSVDAGLSLSEAWEMEDQSFLMVGGILGHAPPLRDQILD